MELIILLISFVFAFVSKNSFFVDIFVILKSVSLFFIIFTDGAVDMSMPSPFLISSRMLTISLYMNGCILVGYGKYLWIEMFFSSFENS